MTMTSLAISLARAAALALPLALTALPASAQGVADPQSIDKIIGTDVTEEEKSTADDEEQILRAIDMTVDNTARVRKVSSLNTVDIVFLADSARTEGGPPPRIEAKVKEREKEIVELRQEIEGNAMLYHAIQSRQILPADVLALEFSGTDSVIIYAAAKQPQK